MIRKLAVVLSFAALPLFAADTMSSSYETTRQALIKTSITDVHASAKTLATAARAEQQEAIAKEADAVATEHADVVRVARGRRGGRPSSAGTTEVVAATQGRRDA